MSFSVDVKNELCELRQSGCCALAECYGMLLFSRSFGLEKINFQTTNEAVCHRFAARIKKFFEIYSNISSGGEKKVNYKICYKYSEETEKIVSYFGYSSKIDFISGEILKKECCVHAFLRGVFLAAGQISDPEKDYRLEISLKNPLICEDYLKLCAALDLDFKISSRAGTTVLYLKDSNVIEEFLTVIGATNAAILIMQSKIYKDMRNKINRISNRETANIFKAVDAAIQQRKAIEILEKKGIADSLEPELVSAIKLRKENPEASLTELCRISPEPITRSGLNHRFRRILEIAQEKNKD